MADTAAPAQVISVKKAAPKKKGTGKPKAPPAHPSYKEMITKAITALKERNGSSRQAILKYIQVNYKVGDNVTKVNARLKLALKSGTAAGVFKHSKGVGAAGSFRVEKKAAAPKPKKKVVKKPAKAAKKSPKKARKPVKAQTKKPAAKKPAAKKPAAKKPAAKKPAAKKPAAKKPAAKKPAAKKPAAKKPAKK